MNLSLKARLLLGAFILIPFTLMVTGVTLTTRFQERREKEFQDSLEVYLRELLAFLNESEGKATLSGIMDDPRFMQPYSKLYWQIDQNNTTIFRSPSLAGYRLALPHQIQADGKIYSYVVSGPKNQTLAIIECKVNLGNVLATVAIAGDHSGIDQATRQFNEAVVILFFSLGAGLCIAVIFQVWGGLRPLQSLHDKLRDIRNGRTLMIEGLFPLEIQPMVDELNALIASNTEVVARSRMQAANLAHGLKTPLAVLTALINNEAGASFQEHSNLQNQIKAIERQIDYTLARTRAALSANIISAYCHVNSRLEKIIYALEILYQERNITIDCEMPADLYVKIEAQDFDEIMGNVLDNACKWAGSKVVMSFLSEPEWLTVLIDDDGPGLSRSQREIVFARGKKLDDTVAGHGLGLSIVRDILESCRGQVALENSPAEGLRVRLILPAVVA